MQQIQRANRKPSKRKMRENAREYITDAFGHASYWLRKWWEILQLIVQHL